VAAAEHFNEIYQLVAERLERTEFAGADPFDALNSRLFAMTPLAALPIARLAWIQLFKRLPWDFRAIAGIKPTVNAVTLALAARTYIRMGQPEKGKLALRRLLALRCDPARWGRGAWGYPFPWQAKSFYVPVGMPNVIATAYALRAVVECEGWHPEKIEPIISEAAAWVARDLTQKSRNAAPYLAYVPNESAIVHNANLWGAYILALAAGRGGDPAWRRLAEDAIEYTVLAQQRDGSWVYGEAAHHQWTDGFHTGYVLEALHLCKSLLNISHLAEPIERGTSFYLNAFLRDDGTVPYYAGGQGPLDANNFAQMAITLEAIRPRPDWPALVDRVLEAAISQLWCPDLQAFAYQRQGKRLVRIVYPRWTQIWMMHALALSLTQPRQAAA